MSRSGPKRTKAQRERDLTQTSEWYCQGWYQFEIAEQLGLSKQQISYDLKAIRKGWLERQDAAYDEIIGQTLTKYDLMERELWEAWHASKQDDAAESKVIVYEPDRKGTPRIVRDTRAGQTNKVGDIAIMRLIDGIIVKRLALLNVAHLGNGSKRQGLYGFGGQIVDGEVVDHRGQPATDAERVRRTVELAEIARSRIASIVGDGEGEAVGDAPDQLASGQQAAE